MDDSNNDAVGSEQVEELPKLPFKRLKYALKQVVDIAIPLHVQLLKQQNENIEEFKRENKELELRSKQIKAVKTVQLLKADLFELERLNLQVREEDAELFNRAIKDSTKDAIEILSVFMDLHSDIFSPLPETECDSVNSSDIFPPLVCNINEESCDTDEITVNQEEGNLVLKQIHTSRSRFDSLNFLQKELVEINGLIKQFAKFVFRQRESVDTIQDNVESANENVLIGTQYLNKASGYKAATFPLAGAVIGGLILGPAGALAGFKIFGSIACVAGGSILGYGAGLKLKEKQQQFNEFEMKALTYPDKSKSRSSPDLSVEHPVEDNTEN